MGEHALFYGSNNKDRVYGPESMEEWLRPFFTTGVFNGEMQVRANNNMTVTVKKGNVNINGKTKCFDEDQNFEIENADGRLPRIDTVVIRRDDTQRDFYVKIIKGTTASRPTAPALVREAGIYDLKLAEIYVAAGVIRITQSNITDTRMKKDVCGWVVATVTEIDFSQITEQFETYFAEFKEENLDNFVQWYEAIKAQQEQWQQEREAAWGQWEEDQKSAWEIWQSGRNADFDEWFASLQTNLSGDVAGNLMNLITELRADIQNFYNEVYSGNMKDNLITDDEYPLMLDTGEYLFADWNLCQCS